MKFYRLFVKEFMNLPQISFLIAIYVRPC